MSLDVIPLGPRIIIEKVQVPAKIGLIITPELAKQRMEMEACEGTVLAIGDEVEKVKIGDVIFYGKYAGLGIERGSDRFYLLNEGDVLGIVIPQEKEEDNA